MNKSKSNLRDQINIITKEFHFTDEDFQIVRLTKYEQILRSIIENFTSLKMNQINKWWWEYFLYPAYSFYSENALDFLPELVKEEDAVWFVIEDERKEKECYWLYEGKISAITTILKKLSFEEYYIVSKKLDWLLCENHHNLLIGCGEPIIRKMKMLKPNL